jgi:thioredoxin reductase (NADPH)
MANRRFLGSGCIAALEAEKFLSEEEAEGERGLEQENGAKKPEANVEAPEHRSNALL